MAERKVILHFDTGQEGYTGTAIEVPIVNLVIAGWTGSDPEAMEAHIVELEKIGVRRPKSTPIFYRAAASLLTQEGEIEVVGSASSGEVEPVLVSTEHGVLLTIGSDHTDRDVEAAGVTISKQMCAKPIAKRFWMLNDVQDHWSELVIRSWITVDGERFLYQEGSLAKMRQPSDLLNRYGGPGYALPKGTVMFCGTVAVHGELRPSPGFEIELYDPVLGRKLNHAYRTIELPIEG